MHIATTLFLASLAVTALAAETEEEAAEATEAAEDAAVEEEAAAPVTYSLQPRADGSSLYVVVYNDPSGLASRFGHDHAVAPTSYQGTVTWSDADPSACDVRISFPVTALTVDPDALRATAKLDPDGAVGDGAKETIKENFLSRGQLYASSFPEITYQSSSCTPKGGGAWDVAGTLTIRGVGKSLTVPMTVSADGETFSARGSFRATHEDFGFKPFTNLAGALRNKSELDFVVDVTGQAQ